MMRKYGLKLTSLLTAAVLIFSPGVYADEESLTQMVKELQKQMADMQSTINRQNDKIRVLETRSGRMETGTPAPTSMEPAPPMSDYEYMQRFDMMTGGAQKWLKDLKFGGDLRLRYEGFHYTSGNPSETDDVNRFRYRLRAGVEKKFSEDMKIGFSLASGEATTGQNVDPTSTNTTFDNNFNFKDVFIEKAYASYTPPFLRNDFLKTTVSAGKMSNPFEKGSSDMVWDRDVKPEGVYEKVDLKLMDGENLDITSYFTAGQFILDADATVGGDAELYAFQFALNPVVYTPMMDRPVELLSALSFYKYANYADKSNFLIGTTSLARGNTNAFDGRTDTLDAQDFDVWEIYNEIGLSPYGLPVRPFFDYAYNVSNSLFEDQSGAYALGVKVGAIVGKGDWELSYAYKRIEPDSVVGAFNDSDFGNGHSGKVGSVFKAGYALTDNLTFNTAAFFVNNLATGNPLTGVRDEEVRRFQVDLSWKF